MFEATRLKGIIPPPPVTVTDGRPPPSEAAVPAATAILEGGVHVIKWCFNIAEMSIYSMSTGIT